MSEFQDEYSESVEVEFRKLEGALLNDAVNLLSPSEPICLPATATVHEAITKMLANRRAAVVIVDGDGRLIGIFTERDVLTRVVGQSRDVQGTTLAEVMTRDPEALSPQDRICFAVNRMNNAGYRTVPLVDAERRPSGIVTVSDGGKWLAELFPGGVLNRRPGGGIKNALPG